MYYVASETQIPSVLSFMLLVTIRIFIGIPDWVVLAPLLPGRLPCATLDFVILYGD
jgi:hypothetical protein